MVGVFLLGIALAIDIDGYEIWSAWVLIAIALWLTIGGFGDKLPAAYKEAGGPERPSRPTPSAPTGSPSSSSS